MLGSLHFHPFAFIIDAVQVNILIASSTAATNATKAMLDSASSRLRFVGSSGRRPGRRRRLVVLIVGSTRLLRVARLGVEEACWFAVLLCLLLPPVAGYN